MEARKQLEERRKLFKRLQDAAPDLAGELMRSYPDVAWDSKMERFVAAWNWARADVWLSSKIRDAGEPEHIKVRLDEIGQQIRDTLKELAEAKAWGNCLSRMTEPERKSLIAWQQAVRSITRRGTGRQDPERRRAAQTNMDNCRTAIPAWIMPLYRVAETINPKPGLFDVVIIDEASQSGPEALFLNYIGKQLVVVGDDKQISPTNVGMPLDAVAILQKQYLKDTPLPDTFGPDRSFFDRAGISYKGRIPLREHFRCMPEIIQFSNNNFYASEPLIPLRQFGASRLKPVVTVQVEGGYREGTGPNPPEARAIVDKIKGMIADPAYNGKTMGVISLVANSNQDKHIEKLLLQEVGPEEMERRKLVCGDPYAFQGDERDVMLLSLVVAPTEPIGSFGKVYEQRFNVAASRAKDQMLLFHSVTLGDLLNKESLHYKLLDYCLNPHVEPISLPGLDLEKLKAEAARRDRRQATPPHPFQSWFELEVFLRIVGRGYRAIPQFEIAGKKIDIVVEGMQGRLYVECDGDEFHGAEQFDADTARQRMLERCGCTFWRVRGGEFYRDPDKALQGLWEELKLRGIMPNVAPHYD